MGGTATASHIGTVRWSVEDDQGVTHDLTIPDTCYCPEAPFRLLCPQHLAQQSNEPSSVLCLTTHQQVILSWQGFTKTIPLLDGSNVALFRSSAGYKAVMALMEDYPQPVCFESHVIPNDEPDDTHENPENITHDVDRTSEGTRKIDENIAPSTEIPRKPNLIDDDMTSFDVNLAEAAQEMEERDVYSQTPTNQLLIWHYRLNHLPFSRLQTMAQNGDLPTSLKECTVPQCATCNYAKATKKPWRTKGRRFARELPTIRKAGDCVSVEQLESSTPGLIAQL